MPALRLDWIFSILSLALIMALQSCRDMAGDQDDLQSAPPNVILLLTDDMGYGDLTCYGGQAVHTPQIDDLAASGMRFTRFYSASAVCTPSRAAIVTGNYPLRYDIRQHFRDRGECLPPSAVTLAELMKAAGYSTAHIGKWHLGGLRMEDFQARQKGDMTKPGPLQHGFDHYLCNIEGDPPRRRLLGERKLYREGGKYLVRNDQRADPEAGFWTDIKVDEAIRLLEKWHKTDQRFFLNIWFDVPHTPYEPAPEPHLSKYRDLGASGDQLYFRSMVSNLDAQIGRLLRKVRSLQLDSNTLILFTSDNGAAYEGEVGPFKGGKTDLHEGGIRVPFIAVWPGKIPGGAISFQTGHHVDLLPTICQAAGIDWPAGTDGVSLLPVLLDDDTIDRGVLLWQMDLYGHLQRHYEKPRPYATGVAYEGPWKLLLDSLQPVELIQLENDPHEVMNVLDQYPGVVDRLTDHVRRLHAAPRDAWHH